MGRNRPAILVLIRLRSRFIQELRRPRSIATPAPIDIFSIVAGDSRRHTQLEDEMRKTQRNQNSIGPRARTLALAIVATLTVTACTPMMAMMRNVHRPAITEFGLGPRTSANGVYVATLQTERALKPRQMQTVRVSIADAAGQPI